MPAPLIQPTLTPQEQATLNTGSIIKANQMNEANKAGAFSAPVTPPQQTTLAQDMAKAANQGKAGYDVLGNPITTISSADVNKKISDNQEYLKSQLPTGQTVGEDGVVRNADNTPATAPNGAVQTEDGFYNSGGLKYASPPLSSVDPDVQAQFDKITAMQSKIDASFAKTIDAIKGQFESLITQQKDINMRGEASLSKSLLMSGTSRYAQETGTGAISAMMSYGLNQIADLNAKELSAMADAQNAYDTKNMQLLNESLSVAKQAKADKIAAAKDLNEKLRTQNQKLQERQQKLDDELNTNKNSILKEAAENGAPPSVLSAISQGKSVADMISAAGDYMQTGTGDVGNYLMYKRDTLKKGLTPLEYNDWLAQDTAKKAKAKASEAYQTAFQTAAGKAVGEAAGITDDSTGITISDPNLKSILAVTGLSIPAFAYMTQGGTALTRMSQQMRLKYMTEAENYVNRTGTDISTFKAQYSALNKTVEANLMRNNQAGVAEAELDATLKNLSNAADDATFSSMKLSNISKMFAGQEFNDANVAKYRFHLEQLRREFAMYNAALEGQIDSNGNIREITNADLSKSESIIKNGFASGSLKGFEDALTASRSKMQTVLKQSINAQNQQVWKLFGVGDKFQPEPLVNPKDGVNEYIKSNPTDAENIAKMYEIPGATDESIYKWLQDNGKLK